MKFVEITDKGGVVSIDGYSNKKTLLGAIREIGRLISALGYDEGDWIVRYGKESLCQNCMDPNTYCLEVEEVPCASQFNEDTDEMEYAEGRWYVFCRFIK